MKKIFLMAMSAALALVACDKDNYNYSGLKEGYGRLSFADAGFVVSEETNTRATETAADNTVIWVYNVNEDGTVNIDEPVDLDPNNDNITYTTYGAVKNDGITLPGGKYMLRAQTADTIPMVGDAAVYGIDHFFEITAGDETPLGGLTLNLYKQVKVSVSYNPEFLESLTENGGTTTVTIDGENFATFNVKPDDVDTDSQYLYLDLTNEEEEVKQAGVSMEITVNVEMNVVEEDGSKSIKTQKMTAAVTGVKPRDWRKIQINKTEIKDGGANFSIVVDDLEVDTELSTDISASEGSLGDDPNAPKGDGGIKLINIAGLDDDTRDSWNAYVTQTTAKIANDVEIVGVHKDAILVNGLTALTFSADVPNKVYNFYVDITSTDAGFNDAVKNITVNKDGRIYLTKTESEHRAVVTSLNGLGISFPFPENVIDKTAVEFPLSNAISALSEFKGTHYFTMNVIDNTGCKNTIVLTLEVE